MRAARSGIDILRRGLRRAARLGRPMPFAALGLLAGVFPSTAGAHHSVSAWFDRNGRQEIEGVVTRIRWENPHVRFFMRAPTSNGEQGIWEIETLSVSGISRWGIEGEMLAAGDRVRVSGWPSKRGLDNIFIRNLLLPNGQELVFGGEPIYTEDALVGSEFVDATDGVAASPELGIFRVWSQGQNTGWLFPEGFVPSFDYRTYPLTPEALEAVESFNYLEQDPTIDCKPKGMPVIMEQPYPIEFVAADDRVLLRIEEYDLVRTIHLADVPDEAEQAYAPLGFSVGRMEGRDLVVETTKINSGTFDTIGIPLSLEARLEERFAPSGDGSTLEYSLVVHDPVYLTAPVETGKTFIYVPGVELREFDCQA
jgi:hypothetical protein